MVLDPSTGSSSSGSSNVHEASIEVDVSSDEDCSESDESLSEDEVVEDGERELILVPRKKVNIASLYLHRFVSIVYYSAR